MNECKERLTASPLLPGRPFGAAGILAWLSRTLPTFLVLSALGSLAA